MLLFGRPRASRRPPFSPIVKRASRSRRAGDFWIKTSAKGGSADEAAVLPLFPLFLSLSFSASPSILAHLWPGGAFGSPGGAFPGQAVLFPASSDREGVSVQGRGFRDEGAQRKKKGGEEKKKAGGGRGSDGSEQKPVADDGKKKNLDRRRGLAPGRRRGLRRPQRRRSPCGPSTSRPTAAPAPPPSPPPSQGRGPLRAYSEGDEADASASAGVWLPLQRRKQKGRSRRRRRRRPGGASRACPSGQSPPPSPRRIGERRRWPRRRAVASQ